MLDKYLPAEISKALDKIPYDALNELRLRCNDDVVVNIQGQNFYLKENSFDVDRENNLKVSAGAIDKILEKISDNSMYTIVDDLINGYVTLSGGVRVGVCGEVVKIDNKLTTLKNISSLNFRFPHFIKNCSLNIYNYIVRNGKIKNTLILSPPGGGKTTYLRDIIYQLSNREKLLNILVVDERDEICHVFNGSSSDKLHNIDIYSKCDKSIGFINGIRSMRPDVIITDEINLEKDLNILEHALTSGVGVIASMHASNIMDIKNKSVFRDIVNKYLFERFIVLSSENGVGTLEGIYDENFELIGR